jgi:hypothetical protein
VVDRTGLRKRLLRQLLPSAAFALSAVAAHPALAQSPPPGVAVSVQLGSAHGGLLPVSAAVKASAAVSTAGGSGAGLLPPASLGAGVSVGTGTGVPPPVSASAGAGVSAGSGTGVLPAVTAGVGAGASAASGSGSGALPVSAHVSADVGPAPATGGSAAPAPEPAAQQPAGDPPPAAPDPAPPAAARAAFTERDPGWGGDGYRGTAVAAASAAPAPAADQPLTLCSQRILASLFLRCPAPPGSGASLAQTGTPLPVALAGLPLIALGLALYRRARPQRSRRSA